jgi:hypothetical protein
MDQSLERWRPVVGYEGLYEVSDLGRVRSLDRVSLLQGKYKRFAKGRVLKPIPNSKGYHLVTLSKDGIQKTPSVHQLVLQAFVGPCPEGQLVRHGPGGKDDNRLSNLSYGTPKQNMADRLRDGTAIYGDTHPMAKLTEEQARWILSMKGVMRQVDIAKQLDVGWWQVSKIIKGKGWAHVHPTPDA